MKRCMTWAAVAGLLIAGALSLGTHYYGASERTGIPKVRAFTAATGDVGETITAADGQTFTWPDLVLVRFAIVQLTSAATGNLYCGVNADAANASGSAWDFYLEPGQSWSGFGDAQVGIESITCFADAAMGTYGTTYVVKGMD